MIRKGGIDAAGEELIDEFIKKQRKGFDVQRGYYAILPKGEQGCHIPTLAQIEARNSVRDKDSDYIIAFLIRADRPETAESFLNIFPNSKLDKSVVEAQLDNEWRSWHLAVSLSISWIDLDFEIV